MHFTCKGLEFYIHPSSLPPSPSAVLIPHVRKNALLTIWDISLKFFLCTYAHLHERVIYINIHATPHSVTEESVRSGATVVLWEEPVLWSHTQLGFEF